jgi:quercetin dioxygenase-like cupin family protein
MRIYHYSEMPEAAIGGEAPGSKKRKLNDVESAVSTAMIEVAPGGHTLRHRHPYEHTMYVVEGTGEARDENGTSPLGPGVFIYLWPDELHEIVNTGSKLLRFLTIEPTQKKEKKA